MVKLPPPAKSLANRSLTAAQRQKLQTLIIPRLQQKIKSHGLVATGKFRTWQEILSNRSAPLSATVVQASAANTLSSSTNQTTLVHFSDLSGNVFPATASVRQYHPGVANETTRSSAGASRVQPSICCRPIGPNPDLDGDGLPDNNTYFSPSGYGGDLEGALAQEFMPAYFISTGEQQQFATFGDYVPWTVVNTLGPNPNSYYHVTPLGLGRDSSGNQVYAVRVDYLSLWNADGGLVSRGGACLYSYFGLDAVIGQLTGHELDAERSVMLLAAPAVNGSYNPNPNAYSIYSIYTAAHEGTFFDESQYVDFNAPVPAGNHVYLSQSLSKHSTYNFNPDTYPITPQWFIGETFAAYSAAYVDGDIDDSTYAFIIAAANDLFYVCLTESFGDQGGVVPILLSMWEKCPIR